jgi:hypothetical protein
MIEHLRYIAHETHEMYKVLLPLAAALALAPAVPALAQTCFEDDGNGNVVNLGSACREHQAAPQPTTPQPAAQGQAPAAAITDGNGFVHNAAATPFPSYFFDADLDNENAYRTGQESYGESALFIYQNRFVVNFSQWPYTASADNRAEWTYLDCATGWLGLKEYGFVESGDTFFIPPAQMNARDAYRSMCNAAGVQARF